MNKNIIYIIVALIVGLLAGWLIFGSDESNVTPSNKTTDSSSHDHGNSENEDIWTCSMHPQIRQHEPGDCPICGMDLIPAQNSSGELAIDQIRMTETALALANIQTTVVGNSSKSDSKNELTLSGTIEINDKNNAVQSSYFKGRLEKLNVNYVGQLVKRGQLLGTIYAPDLVAAQQELLTASNLKNTQPKLYEAVRKKLKNLKLTDQQINSIEASGKVRENFLIYATVSGTVTAVMAREGDYVAQGQSLLEVSKLDTVWASFDTFENQLKQIELGQEIRIKAPAYSEKEFKGRVSFIDPILNNATRTVTVRATLENDDDLLKPSMFVTGTVSGTQQMKEEALKIPATAVMWTGKRSIVYMKTNPDEPVFELREVQLSDRANDYYFITSGLERGDEIVTNGTFTVDAAAQLQGKRSMMNQQKKSDDDRSAKDLKMNFPDSFGSRFQSALRDYLKMKDAFVVNDAGGVSAFAKAVLKKLDLMKNDSLGNMEKQHLSKSMEMLKAIASNTNIENQRSHFVILNENLVAIAANMENLDEVFYVQQCPMANKNKGAKWISQDKKIRNPYYGDEMLTCGSTMYQLP